MFKRNQIWWSVVGGVRVSLRTSDKADAEALEARLKHEHYQQEYLGAKRPRLWEEACERWAKESSHKLTWHDDLRAICFWTPHFQGQDIRLITREQVDEIVRQEREVTPEASSQNNTANHYVTYLAAILNAAARKWDWIDKAPLLRRYPVSSGRKRFVTVQEWQALSDALPDYLRQPATFALATGIRRGSLLGLSWERVDCKQRFLTFSGHANKLGNTIPLNDTAMQVLEEIQSSPVRHMNLVFTKNGNRLNPRNYPEWYRALDKCGLRGGDGEDFCWHGLRHTWASWMAQAGVPEWARKRLGGWSSREVVDRYSHLDLESLRSHASVIDRILAETAKKELTA